VMEFTLNRCATFAQMMTPDRVSCRLSCVTHRIPEI
jgi:hypothetical protein